MQTRMFYATSAIFLLAACSDSASNPTAPALSVRSDFTLGGITAVDISNGITGGGARTISSTGIILGRIGSTRGWWQSPSPTFTVLDSGFAQGGNRNADIGGTQGTVLLSTNGGAPWVSSAVASPTGVAQGLTIVHDLNDSRVMVGRTLGTGGAAIRWENPSTFPTQLPMPALQYSVTSSVARSINNHGVIVGYAVESAPKNKGVSSTIYEAIIWDGTTVSVLPRAAGVTTQLASNINDAGVISGIANGNHPVRWIPRLSGGYDVTVAALDVGGTNLDTGINACGTISGGSDSGAWVWQIGSSAPMLLPSLIGPGYWGNALDVSEAGIAVGSSFVHTSKGARITKATIWTGLPACSP